MQFSNLEFPVAKHSSPLPLLSGNRRICLIFVSKLSSPGSVEIANTMSQKLKRKAGDQDGQGQAKKIKGDPELTEFAKMYSHPPWFLKDPDDPLSYIDPLRSGISPLGQGPFSTEAERNEYLVLEEYQKRVFHRESGLH